MGSASSPIGPFYDEFNIHQLIISQLHPEIYQNGKHSRVEKRKHEIN
jgi:hypothetical protein